MFTRFLPERCLVLIVDCFADDEVREINQTMIERATRQFPHLDVVVYDTTLHIRDIPPLIQMMVDWMLTRHLAPEKCLIANYLRFRGCSAIDTSQFEVDVPRKIYAVLSETRTYVGCFYQWFGYQYYTYHLLYSYSKYDMSRHLKIIMLFHECADSMQVVSSNASRLFEVVKYSGGEHINSNQKVLMDFMRHTLDITSYGKTPDALSSNMSEYIASRDFR